MSTTTNTGAVAPNNQTPATQPRTRVDALKSIMASPSVQEQFKNALKDNSGPFVASIIDLYNGDSYLQKCNPTEVVMECLKAATLKLPINKSLGFAYIVPYNNVPQFQIGYKGLIQLAMRTGQYRIINADMVYEGEFRTMNKLTGEFDLSGQKSSDVIVGYFAHIEMLNGFSKTLYMTKEKVTNHAKKYSKSFAKDSSPWKKEFDAMAIKTVLRNLLGHYGFLSVDMISAFDNDSDMDASDRVQSDVDLNANKEDLKFDDAEVVDNTGENNRQAGDQNQNGQGTIKGPGF
jgi:recombination protein RecT